MRFLIFSFFCFVALPLALCQSLPLPALRYDYNALEPLLSETQMRFHHLKHHQTYTDNLNNILEKLRADTKTRQLVKGGVDSMLTKMQEIPEPLRTSFRNQAGGYVNHEIFFRMLKSPVKGNQGDFHDSQIQEGPLLSAIKRDFKSFDEFKTQFNAAANSVFGSGWTFLFLREGKLQIATTANQDTPASVAGTSVLLAFDEWEHAYYLSFQNRRADFLSSWWKMIDWQEAEVLYKEKTQKKPKAEL